MKRHGNTAAAASRLQELDFWPNGYRQPAGTEKELEIWTRAMQKQSALIRKAADAASLAQMLLQAMPETLRAEVLKKDSIRYSINNLIGYGYSWLP